MEKLCAVGSRAFCQLILSFSLGDHFLNYFFSILAFSFLTFLVLSAIIVAFSFAYKALNNVSFTILAQEGEISHILELVVFNTKLFDLKLGGYIIEIGITLIFDFLFAFFMEGPLAITFTEYATFGFLAKATKFLQIFLFFSFRDFVLVRALLFFLFLFLVTENVVVLLGSCINLFLRDGSWSSFVWDFQVIDAKLLEATRWLTNLLQPLTCQVSVMFMDLTLRVDNCQELA